MSPNRISALADGIFAIVMTLIVFDLRLPEGTVDVGADLLKLATNFVGFAITFVIVGQYWVAHHNQMAYVKKVDQVYLWLNIVYLMGASLVPFTARLLGQYSDQRVVQLLYSLNLSLMSLMHLILWRYLNSQDAQGQPRLAHTAITPDGMRLAYQLSLVPIALYTLAFLVSFVSVPLSFVVYFSVPIWIIWMLVTRLNNS